MTNCIRIIHILRRLSGSPNPDIPDIPDIPDKPELCRVAKPAGISVNQYINMLKQEIFDLKHPEKPFIQVKSLRCLCE